MHTTRSLVIYIAATALLGLAIFIIVLSPLTALYTFLHSLLNSAAVWDEEPVWRIPVAIVLAGLGAYHIFWFFVRRQAIKELRKKPSLYPVLFGDRTGTISKQGYKFQSPSGSDFTSWVQIEKLVSSKEYIYLFKNPQTAYILPKRAFESKEETQKFLDVATSFWKDTGSRHIKGKSNARLSTRNSGDTN